MLRSLGKQTSLTVPIIFEGSTWGELWATSCAGSPHFVNQDARFLRAIADQIAAAVGRAAAAHPDAVVSRIGGDEFCVLVPSGDGAAARALSVEAMRRLRVASGVELSISCGISAGGPELTRPVALLPAADFAQYQAKAETAGISARAGEWGPSGCAAKPRRRPSLPRRRGGPPRARR